MRLPWNTVLKLFVPAIALLLVLPFTGLTSEPETPAHGSVTGTITYDDQVPPPGRGPFAPLDLSADPACAKMHDDPVYSGVLVLGDGNTMGNVFVQVKNPPAGNHDAPREAVVIDQQGCFFVPRVVGVMAGQPLSFKNSDGFLHNVHGLPQENREFNIGMPPTLKEESVSLNKPEPVFTVKCDVHPWMNSYVAVMSHPYFAVTGEDGTFAIDGLPDGTYEVEAWHERLGTQTARVTIRGGRTTATANFSFTRP
jgi:plastocyanin